VVVEPDRTGTVEPPDDQRGLEWPAGTDWDSAGEASASEGWVSDIDGEGTPHDHTDGSVPVDPVNVRTRRTGELIVAIVAALLFVIGVVAVVNGGVRLRSGYFATIADNRIEIFKGEPGTFFWVKPTLAYSKGQASSTVGTGTPISNGTSKSFTDLAGARGFIQDLTDRQAQYVIQQRAIAAAQAESAAEAAATQAVYPQVQSIVASMQQASNAWDAIWPCAPGGGCGASLNVIASGVNSGVLPAFQSAAATAQAQSSSNPAIQSFLTALQGCAASAVTFANSAYSEASGDGSSWPPETSMLAMNSACNAATSSQPTFAGWTRISSWPNLLFNNYGKS
jgi:hypothetical protein